MPSPCPIEDKEKFFEIVQTTPDLIEAGTMVRQAMAKVKEEIRLAGLARDNDRQSALGATNLLLKAELHRLQQIDNHITWQKTVKAVCGEDLYEQCIVYMESTKAGIL